MNNTFKISSLAVLVAVAVTGCSKDDWRSYDLPKPVVEKKAEMKKEAAKPTEQSKPTEPTTPVVPSQPTEPTTPVVPSQPTEPTAPVAPNQPTEPTTPVAPSQPTEPTTPVAPSQPTEPTTPVVPSQPTEPTTPVVPSQPTEPTTPVDPIKPTEPEKIVSIDSEGKKWRIVDLYGNYRGESSNVDYNYQRGNYSRLVYKYRDVEGNQCYYNNCDGDVLRNSNQVNQSMKFHLDELAQKDGKPLLGTHSGKVDQEYLNGKVIDAHFNDKGKLVSSSSEPTGVNYLFTNQPYSSYGALFTNQNDISLFYLAQEAGLQGQGAEYDVYKRHLHQGNDTGRLVWNDNVKGKATYKGEVIATKTTYQPEQFDYLASKPEVDGSITLNANFGNTWDETVVSGELNSKSVGKIALPQDNLDGYLTGHQSISHTVDESGKKLNGYYRVQFGGKDLNDAVGYINLDKNTGTQYLDKGEVRGYQAVFGATKQPK